MNSADLEGLNAAKVIDARMDPCPGPLLDAKEVIKQVNAGEIIEIQAGDPEARRDISAWAMKAGHEFLGVLDTRGFDRIFVLKKTQ